MLGMLERLDRSQRAGLGVVLAVVLLLAVNMLSNTALRGVHLDLTEGRLYTLSEGTYRVLDEIDEPLDLTLFFSRALGEASPDYARYATRVRELLQQYANIAAGRIRLTVEDPAPFSDAEDRAVGFGLQGIPVNQAGDLGYFGLVGHNSTDDQEVVRFFSPEREGFLEYDLTKTVHRLVHPKRPSVGLISSLPISGTFRPPFSMTPRWAVIENLTEIFEVMPLPPDVREIPEQVDMLMVVHPKDLSDHTLYAIDQFVVRGGGTLIFVDPHSEADVAMMEATQRPSRPDSSLNRLTERWGVRLVEGRVAGDLDTARRVNLRVGEQFAVADYVAWLGLTPANFDREDIVTGALKSVNMATPGILERVEGTGATIAPLIEVGPRSMAIPAERFLTGPDVVGLFREFEPQNQRLMLAARISGALPSAFPDGPPRDGSGREDPRAADHRIVGDTGANVVVVADTDVLHDRFWVEESESDGYRLLVPFADNADFVINALEMLGGSDALVGLRGRSASVRPFEYVQEIRQDAEKRYRAKEAELREKLGDIQRKMGSLVRREIGTEGAPILSRDDRAAIESGRAEMVAIRRELRDVQHALRADIERLDAWLKFLNIAAIPLLLALGTVVTVVVMRLRRRRYLSPH